RRALPPAPPDRRRRAAGAARVSLQTAAWLVLAMPLAGTLAIALLNRGVLSGRAAGFVGTAAIGLSFVFALITFFKLEDLPSEERVVTSALWDLANVAGVHIQLGIYVDPLSTL